MVVEYFDYIADLLSLHLGIQDSRVVCLILKGCMYSQFTSIAHMHCYTEGIYINWQLTENANSFC